MHGTLIEEPNFFVENDLISTGATCLFYTFPDHVPAANNYWFDQRSLAFTKFTREEPAKV